MSGKIEISRELAPCPLCGAEAESRGYADLDQLFVQCTDCGCSVEVGSGRFEIWNKRAAPVVERQEPVYQYRVQWNDIWCDISKAEFEEKSLDRYSHTYITRKLYTSPPAPVAVVLPELKDTVQMDGYQSPWDAGWNSCLDKVKELNQ